MVLTIRVGASSTVTGAISRLNTVPEISFPPEAPGDIGIGIGAGRWVCCPARGPAAAAAPASFRKSRRSIGVGFGIEKDSRAFRPRAVRGTLQDNKGRYGS